MPARLACWFQFSSAHLEMTRFDSSVPKGDRPQPTQVKWVPSHFLIEPAKSRAVIFFELGRSAGSSDVASSHFHFWRANLHSARPPGRRVSLLPCPGL